MILAIEVERMYTKDQILGMYLNESPYGGRRNGVESAAQTYFAKSSSELTVPEEVRSLLPSLITQLSTIRIISTVTMRLLRANIRSSTTWWT